MFANSNVEYTVPVTEGETVQIPATGHATEMGVVSITAKDSVEAYTGGASFGGEVDYIVSYAQDSDQDGELSVKDEVIAQPSEVGKYFVVAIYKSHAGKGDWAVGQKVSQDFLDASGYIAQYFEITRASLDGAVAVNGENASNETFAYTGLDQMANVNFALDGKLLEKDVDYTVQFPNIREVVNAGEYTAVLTGKGVYDGSTETVKFTVGKLDLAAAAFFTPDQDDDDALTKVTELTTINGVEGSDIDAIWKDVDWAVVSYKDSEGKVYGAEDSGFQTLSSGNVPARGGYTVRVAAKADSKNVTGENTYTVNVCDKVVPASDFLYDGKQLDTADGLNGRTFDLSKDQAYDASKITVSGQKASDYTVSLATEDAATPGRYTVDVAMKVPADYSIGGSSQATFDVIASIDTKTVAAVVLINGNNVPFKTTYNAGQYTGEAVVPSITLKAGDKVLAEGEDYAVEIEDANGNAVESMVDAGTYTVTIKSDYYTIQNGDWFKVTIAKRVLKNVAVSEPVEDSKDAQGILYTGSAISPEVTGAYDTTGKVITLDPSWYQLTGLLYKATGADNYNPADEVLEVGDYQVNITPTTECANYTWDANMKDDFRVIATSFYTDVAADAWYADEVYRATVEGYVNGVGDTKLFMPENDINRAELAQVLFNMAGQARAEGIAYPTPFSDVDAFAWFAQPVAWAYSAGVVTGMGDTGTYAPFENATREQVAAMFYRYAKAQGMDVSGTADLSAYADGSAVSGWAAEAVEWAVSEGVFGKGTDVLRPAEPISRAEVAAMAVRLQPEKLTSADVTA